MLDVAAGKIKSIFWLYERYIFFIAGLLTFFCFHLAFTHGTIENGVHKAAQEHAKKAADRIDRCWNVDWIEACEGIGQAGARRRRLDLSYNTFDFMEEALLDSLDPSVTYGQDCLRTYRLDVDNNFTFPYVDSRRI